MDGRPTLVLNAETSAQLAVLALLGPDEFAAVGDRAEPGTALLSISGLLERPGVYEIPTGTPVGVPLISGGAPANGWVLTRGLTGSWIELELLRRLPFATSALGARRASRGVGSLVVMGGIEAPGTGCVLAETARILSYLADESAGRCARACSACRRSPPTWRH